MRSGLVLAILLGAQSARSLMGAEIKPSDPKPKVVVFAGDDVIPHVVDGGLWKTTFKFVNLENHTVTFTLSFIQDNGEPLVLPILGNSLLTGGAYTSLSFTLLATQSATVQTAGAAAALTEGWAFMQQAVVTDSIGGFAIFTQHIPGGQDQEATVPVVNQFSGHFVLLFDNTAYITGIAIANPTNGPVSIPVNIRNEAGQLIDQELITLGPFGHTAFGVPTTWPKTAGIAGGIEFIASGYGVGALGLRFNGAAFTTFNILENYAWLAPQQ
jgi:hypothetical protein